MHPGCNPMYPGAHAMGWPHQQLPQRCAPEQHESDTLLTCFPCTRVPLADQIGPHAPCPTPFVVSGAAE